MENRNVSLNGQLQSNEQELRRVNQELEALRASGIEQQELISSLEESLELLNKSRGSAPNSPEAESSKEGDDSMFQIVCRQRDRFKNRITTLESEIRLAEESTVKLRSQAETLRQDNLKLYQKVRYLESYNARAGSPNSGRGGGHHRDARATRPSGDLEEQKYQALFEASVDPFQEFSKQAMTSRFRDLNVAEKCTYYTGKFMTANKYTRTFIFAYTVLLHLLVYSLLRY